MKRLRGRSAVPDLDLPPTADQSERLCDTHSVHQTCVEKCTLLRAYSKQAVTVQVWYTQSNLWILADARRTTTSVSMQEGQ